MPREENVGCREGYDTQIRRLVEWNTYIIQYSTCLGYAIPLYKHLVGEPEKGLLETPKSNHETKIKLNLYFKTTQGVSYVFYYTPKNLPPNMLRSRCYVFWACCKT